MERHEHSVMTVVEPPTPPGPAAAGPAWRASDRRRTQRVGAGICKGWPACLLLLALAAPVYAQGPPEPQIPAAAASPVPASQQGMNMTSAQNPYLGGVPSGTATPGTVSLTLSEAISRGLKQNLGVVISEQATRSAEGNLWSARAGLLPYASASVGESRQTVNLEAYGFPTAPGESPLVGPFNVLDARVSLSQTVFSWSAIQSARAGGEALKAAKYSYKDARDLVVFTVANLYLQAVTGASQIEAAQAQTKTAQALYDRAVDMKNSGLVPAIDVLRAQVQLQAQQQRLIYYENDFAKRKLTLARAIGLPLDQRFELPDKMPYAQIRPPSLDDALAQAYQSRSDYLAAHARLRAARDAKAAASAERLPSLGLTANVGKIGPSADRSLKTYSIAAGVRVPIFEGGTIRARVLEADAALKQQQAQFDDLRARIDYEVRSTFLDLKAADDRVQVARSARDLAGQQLGQAQDRFSAGVASSIEVVQAQEAVATASDNYISSLYAYNLAKISLARALGVAETEASRFLGGTR
jgi:outer membrane protein TolC